MVEDFEYIIIIGGQERVTYRNKLTPIDTENDEPSAPPLMPREYEDYQSPYPTPFSQAGVVHMI